MFLAPASALIVCVVLHAQFSVISAQCPTGENLHRLGKTRFYIIQNVNKRDSEYVIHRDAYAQCKKYNLKLAKLKNMYTLAIAARPLEKLAVKHKLKDTFYWLDAKYNVKEQLFYWGQNGQDGEVKYSNFLYRKPRPTGVNSHVNTSEYHIINSQKEQCIQLSLPYFGPWDSGSAGTFYGHQTMLDERHCTSHGTRHSMCETDKKECDFKSDDAFVFSEGKADYFEKGNWIFGDRAFVVNWQYRTREDSIAYCTKRGLSLFLPNTKQEAALIPYLKMWSREMTTSQFWTDLTYLKNGSYVRPDGSVIIVTNKPRISLSSLGQAEGRSIELDEKFCVSMIHSYEFKTQTPCGMDKQNSSTTAKCSWSYLEYAPTNCKNYLATICQHKNSKDRSIVWKKEYVKNVDMALTETATIEFGFAGNKQTLRSRYKQTFGALVCPAGYRMARYNNKDWHKKPASADYYMYDFMETYWVVDKDRFNKDASSTCTISVPNDQGFTRTQKQVKCASWYFYLCEFIDKPVLPWNGTLNKAEPMKWKEGPQRRPYPIKKK